MRWICILLLTVLKINFHHPPAQIHQGFALVHASDKYCCPSLFEKIFFGTNYRREWATIVRMPVFDISKTNFQVIEMGGGQQTTSLSLIDEKNRERVLRSIDENLTTSNRFDDNHGLNSVVAHHVCSV